MARLVVAVALIAAALAVAAVLSRRRVTAPPSQPHFAVPSQLDRGDFHGPDAPWLVVAFTSATCHTCADVVAKAKVLACADVAVDEVEYGGRPGLHARYHIDAVPMVLIADGDGVVRASFVGPVTATDLWAAVAECRQPGSSPEPELGRQPAAGAGDEG